MLLSLPRSRGRDEKAKRVWAPVVEQLLPGGHAAREQLLLVPGSHVKARGQHVGRWRTLLRVLLEVLCGLQAPTAGERYRQLNTLSREFEKGT